MMLRRYAITGSLLLLLLCHCAPPAVSTADQCEGDRPCQNSSAPLSESTPVDEMAIPPAAATGLADRLRPIDTNSANPPTNPGDIPPPENVTIDPFTGQLLDVVLLPDLLPLLTDSLILNLVDPGASLSDRTFLEQSCRNRGIEDFICRQRYGS